MTGREGPIALQDTSIIVPGADRFNTETAALNSAAGTQLPACSIAVTAAKTEHPESSRLHTYLRGPILPFPPSSDLSDAAK
ncbi:hypothetical protein VTH82DRAFT_1264 [Thermothelomyces myriococcoides]